MCTLEGFGTRPHRDYESSLVAHERDLIILYTLSDGKNIMFCFPAGGKRCTQPARTVIITIVYYNHNNIAMHYITQILRRKYYTTYCSQPCVSCNNIIFRMLLFIISYFPRERYRRNIRNVVYIIEGKSVLDSERQMFVLRLRSGFFSSSDNNTLTQ